MESNEQEEGVKLCIVSERRGAQERHLFLICSARSRARMRYACTRSLRWVRIIKVYAEDVQPVALRTASCLIASAPFHCSRAAFRLAASRVAEAQP